MPQPFQVRYWLNSDGRVVLGGINDMVSDEYTSPLELADARNYIPDVIGGGILTKREGLTKVDSDSVASNISSIYQGRNGTFLTAGTKTYNSSITEVDSGLTAGYPSWTTFATYDIMVNGTNARKTSNGSTFTDVSGMPSGAKYVAAANNFLYCAGHDKGKLRWADIGTAETWTATNELVLTQDENDDITGIAPWQNVLLVTCYKSFETISGYSTTEMGVSYYSKAVGCKSHRSIVITPVGAFWWDSCGLVWCKPDFSIDRPMLRKIPKTLANLNRAYDQYVHGVHDPIQRKVMYFLFYGASQTTVNMRADYYYDQDAWYLHSGTGTAMLSSALVLESGQPVIYVGGYGPTYLYKYVHGSTDDGTNISAYLKTHRESSPGMLGMSHKTILTVSGAGSSTVTYGVYVNDGTSLDTSWSLSVSSGTSDYVIGVNRQFYKLQHYVADASAYSNKVYGLTHNGQYTRIR